MNEYIAKIFRVAGMALLLWIVPSAASLGFYDRSGRLNVSPALFSSLITVALSAPGSRVLLGHCRSASGNLLWEGSLTGIILLSAILKS